MENVICIKLSWDKKGILNIISCVDLSFSALINLRIPKKIGDYRRILFSILFYIILGY